MKPKKCNILTIKTWKWLKGKENARTKAVSKMNFRTEQQSKKCTWKLKDENDNLSIELVGCKRTKEIPVDSEEDVMEVGVSSLKWPQIHQ